MQHPISHYFFNSILAFLLVVAAQDCGKKANEDNCFSERKTIKTLASVEGVVEKVGKDMYVIYADGYNNQRYSPCNLQDIWKVDGKKVRFSGKEKETYPNERWAGLPFVISMIQQN